MTGPTHKLADGTRVFPEGYDPADLTEITDGDLLGDAKAVAYAQVKSLREQHKDGGIMIPGIGPIETDPDSRTNINGAVQMATILGASFSIDWRCADNTVATLDAAGMIQMGLLVGQHVAACQYRKNELDAAINAATTLAELEVINPGAGWP